MTNATAHTPGPWGVLETCHETRPWSVTDEQDCTIAMVVQNPLGDQNTSSANARLIAAAPDGLTANKMALAYLEDDCEPHWSPEQRAVVESLRDAIAKATGA